MDDVEDLVVTPFRDIVEKGKTAIGNAGDNEPMIKAATALVKEGERALRRIEPLCKKHVDDYGSNFIISIKENDDIAGYRTELTDLLWEFDDYTDPESFEVEKFLELQSLSRKAAPRIYDILMRMKLEAPVKDDQSIRGSFASLPTPTSPPMFTTTILGPPPPPPQKDLRYLDETASQFSQLMSTTSSSHGDHPSPIEPPPRPPSVNPWDVNSRPAGQDDRSPEQIEEDRKAALAESPILPHSPLSADYKPHYSAIAPPPVSTNGGLKNESPVVPRSLEERPLSIASTSSTHTFGGFPRGRQATIASTMSTGTIPEDATSSGQPSSPKAVSPKTMPPDAGSPARSQRSRGMSFGFSGDEQDFREASARPGFDSRMSYASYSSHGTSRQSFSTLGGFSPASIPAVPHCSGIEVVAPPTILEAEDGLIPVEMEEEKKKEPEPLRSEVHVAPEDCAIGVDSSFHQAKGFCEGAKEVIRGDIGVKKTKKPVGFTSAATVARCVGCLYELDFGEIEADVNRKDKGNFTRNGINFRVRFLQKSHIATKRVDDVQYACVFCVQQGHTLDPSDATVFFSQKTLFEHLARHPRPLPEVQGIVTVQGEEMPQALRNDYDIHFRKPPQRHTVKEREAEISHLPTAVAREPARRLYGQRLLYDRTPALELAQGAKITGITWPSQYQGEWAFGWHDGAWASVPFDLLRLDPPPKKQLKYDGMSMVKAKSRWKFAQKDKDKESKGEWLKFDKNEVITNIAWSYHEHWCWTGTNSKGKTGMFPSAFIDMDSVQLPTSSGFNRANSVFEEKNRSMSVLSVFSSRKGSSGRPPSIAESTSSRGTNTSGKKNRKFAPLGDSAGGAS